MTVADISKITSTISALFVVLACLLTVGRNMLRSKAESNLSRYIALCISKLLLQGRDVLWDDLLELYDLQSRSLLGLKCSISYKQMDEILSTAKHFLIDNFPAQTDKWQRKIKNAYRSIPTDSHGQLITIGKSEASAPLKAAYREVVFFIPIVNIFAIRILNSEIFWAGADILIPGLIVIGLFQALFELSIPHWIAFLLSIVLILLACALCSLHAIRYVYMVRSALYIPNVAKKLEISILQEQ